MLIANPNKVSALHPSMVLCIIPVGKPEGKRTLDRPSHSCEGRIKMHLEEIGCRLLVQWWALLNTVVNLQVP
jgi:hypothetical protein